uniref:Uncharacterized protein n=1 Tax=Oryza meridionalis TaxID=40149 RepID=A0A0E0F4W8_9ORYZ
MANAAAGSSEEGDPALGSSVWVDLAVLTSVGGLTDCLRKSFSRAGTLPDWKYADFTSTGGRRVRVADPRLVAWPRACTISCPPLVSLLLYT